MNVCNYDGYDREAVLAAFELRKAEFEAAMAARENDSMMSDWAIIFNTDAIMWKNNLMEVSMQTGLELDLDQVRIIRVAEAAALTCLDNAVERLWVLRCYDGQAVLSCRHKEESTYVFAWEKEEDAKRFAINLEEDGRGKATPELMPLVELKGLCKKQKSVIGFVAPSFVQPSHFGHGSL
jgi:Protein of unknown function (DUF3110)